MSVINDELYYKKRDIYAKKGYDHYKKSQELPKKTLPCNIKIIFKYLKQNLHKKS